MKKAFKTLLLILCLCPLLLLSACTPPDKFLISAIPSDISFGNIDGVVNEELDEGTKITLSARETDPIDHPFICWIKDYNKFVGNNKNLNLTYKSSAAGQYIAVFEEDPQSMIYATLSQIEFKPVGFANATYDISYSMDKSGSSDYKNFFKGSYSTADIVKTDYKSIIYLGSVGVKNEYKFKVNLKLQASASSETNYEVQISSLLNKATFNEEGKCTLTQYIEEVDASLMLTFEKLNYNMYH